MKTPQIRSKKTFIYGPVPSRRLGYSLGVDILPFKTCSLNCVYCQLGPSTKKKIKRKMYFPHKEILQEIQSAIKSNQKIDYITFSGSGEPTLNVEIGPLIREIKKITKIPVAVLTNSTLLSVKKVREDLKAADLVVPSLDTSTQETFERVNRPHPSLRLDKVVHGLKLFRKEFEGKIWMEVMFVKGMNDSNAHIQTLKQIISEIKPEKVQLNTVVRPPAEVHARPLTHKELERIRKILGSQAEIIAEFSHKPQILSRQDIKREILVMAHRRPVTMKDITDSLGRQKEDLSVYINELVEQGKIKPIEHRGKTYYEPN